MPQKNTTSQTICYILTKPLVDFAIISQFLVNWQILTRANEANLRFLISKTHYLVLETGILAKYAFKIILVALLLVRLRISTTIAHSSRANEANLRFVSSPSSKKAPNPQGLGAFWCWRPESNRYGIATEGF